MMEEVATNTWLSRIKQRVSDEHWDIIFPMLSAVYKIYEGHNHIKLEFFAGTDITVVLPRVYHLQIILHKTVIIPFNGTLITMSEDWRI